jgi:chitinase
MEMETVEGFSRLGTINAGRAGSAPLTLTINTDTTTPTVPTNLTDPSVTSSQVNLAWTLSTDNVRVKGYNVYRAKENGNSNDFSIPSLIGTPSVTS